MNTFDPAWMGTRRDLDEYRRASSNTFLNYTPLLSLTGLRQRLPNPLPDPGLGLSSSPVSRLVVMMGFV